MAGLVVGLLEVTLGGRFIDEYFNAKRTVEDIVEEWPSVVLDAFPRGNILQRVLVAEAVERGAALVSVQHGGWYGEIGYYGEKWVIERISDMYATWGYETEELDVGLPAAKLMNERQTKLDGESLLWLSRSVDHWGDYLYPATFFDVIDGVNGPNEGQNRFQRAAELYDSLRMEIRGDILLRFDYKHLPDVKGYMRQLKRRIEKRLTDVTVDPGGVMGLEERIQQARLILVDHVPSTVFAECIHSGVPTILFDKTDEKWLTDNAREVYQALQDAGVLYQDAEAAARKIDEIYPDPLEWWESGQVTAAVNRYRDEFAYVGDRPVEEWAAFMEELDGTHSQ
jgi:putative transferase (TIGR04331 family)